MESDSDFESVHGKLEMNSDLQSHCLLDIDIVSPNRLEVSFRHVRSAYVRNSQ